MTTSVIPQAATAPVAAVNNQPATNEGQPNAPEAAAPPDASRYADLARKEKAIRDREKALKAERDALIAEKAQNSGVAETFAAYKKRLKEDTLALLQEEGLSYDQLTQAQLNAGDPQAQMITKLERKIQELEEGQKKTLGKFDEVQKQQYDDAVKQIRTDVVLAVDGDENFETIKSMNAYDAVVELIEHTFQTNGTLMNVDDAAKEVEEYLLEEALKYAKLKKVQAKMAPSQPVPEETQKPVESNQKPQMKTLSNSMVQSTKPLTANERRARAIAAFQGKQA